MAQQPGGWYDDPTNRYMYRYWNGSQWTDQVASGTTNSTDPTPMDSAAVATPPAPGTGAPTPSPSAATPTVQVTQKSGSSFGTIIGVLLALVAVVVLVNNSGDDRCAVGDKKPDRPARDAQQVLERSSRVVGRVAC